MASFKIGELTKRCNVGIETIRFYERKGILDQPVRRASGYRQYDNGTVVRLNFIRRTKALGFTLIEIRELLDLWLHPNTQCRHIREKAADKIRQIDERIASLRTIRRSLLEIKSRCERRDSLEECPLLEDLNVERSNRKPVPARKKPGQQVARKSRT